jgi:hypothetical protein
LEESGTDEEVMQQEKNIKLLIKRFLEPRLKEPVIPIYEVKKDDSPIDKPMLTENAVMNEMKIILLLDTEIRKRKERTEKTRVGKIKSHNKIE